MPRASSITYIPGKSHPHFALGLVSLVLVSRPSYIWPSMDSRGSIRYIVKCNYTEVLFFISHLVLKVQEVLPDVKTFVPFWKLLEWWALLYMAVCTIWWSLIACHLGCIGDYIVTPMPTYPFSVKCSWNIEHWLQPCSHQLNLHFLHCLLLK